MRYINFANIVNSAKKSTFFTDISSRNISICADELIETLFIRHATPTASTHNYSEVSVNAQRANTDVCQWIKFTRVYGFSDGTFLSGGKFLCFGSASVCNVAEMMGYWWED